ncbi:type II secretion system protein [Psychroserpens algicola]|uniref:Type II secretion system GspH family protein n=1 Tax=Psychroserpens algicola TaxID=1719034 RepID=A0ABT0H990_9FLAO|nr:type II secretion system protein [Psychroserpens algicola]MCK8480933.1 type II secretion system GspH family protein [Psychroserpens algicola]
MNKKTNIAAFTLLESLITLMLISIIIALSYALINLIGKQLSVFEKENTQILEYNLFNSTLINDINNAYNYSFDTNHLLLSFYKGDTIDYYIQKKKIIRRHNSTRDSFHISNVAYSFYKSPNTKGSKAYLELKLELLKDTITTNYYLKKSNAERLNNILFNED